MAAYPSFYARFLIQPNKRLKFISLYIIITIAGIVIARLSEPIFLLITRSIRRVFSYSASPEAAMAFGLISSTYVVMAFSEAVIKCMQWVALFKYGGINFMWPSVVIISQLLRGSTTTWLRAYTSVNMQNLGIILFFIPSVAESFVLNKYVKEAWLWFILDVFEYTMLALTSQQLRLYPDESPIFLIIQLLFFAIKLGCLCLFRRKSEMYSER